MARVSLDLPARFSFATELDIHFNHINAGGHLDNAILLMFVSEARVRFFRSLGYDESAVEGLATVVADAAVQYRSEGLYGETMVVEMMADDFNKYGFDLRYRISEKTMGREVARGKSGIVFIDPATRKIAPLPGPFRDRVLAREARASEIVQTPHD